MIPPIIHFIWIQGFHLRPDHSNEVIQSWAGAHQGWSIRCWDEESLQGVLQNPAVAALVNGVRRALSEAVFPVQRADIYRLLLLFAFGGVYTDLDMMCLKNIQPLLDGKDVFMSMEHDNFIGNGFMASVPQHPLISNLLDKICIEGMLRFAEELPSAKRCRSALRQLIFDTTGPHLLTRFLLDEEHGDVYIERDTTLIFPHPFKLRESRGSFQELKVMYPDSFMVHLYDQSWVSSLNEIIRDRDLIQYNM